MKRLCILFGAFVALVVVPAAPAFAYGPNAPSVVSSVSSTQAGGSLTVTGSGFQPNAVITLVLHSTPVTLGTTTADPTGAFSDAVTIPSGTAPGDHEIIASDPEGDSASTEILVTGAVVSSGGGTGTATTGGGSSLAFTGADIAMVTTLGALALALGGMLLLMGRKRRLVR